MKICPKCRRTYADSVDFCLRDGKPLVSSEAEIATSETPASGSATSPPPEPAAAPFDAPPRSGAAPQRPPSLFQTGVLQSVKPPEPVASARRDKPATGSPALPSIKPWVPGGNKDRGAAGVRLTLQDGASSQLPPWELVAQGLKPGTGSAPPPEVVAAPEPELEPAAVRTPDLPLPPEIREEAAPVGDETVLVLTPEEDLEDSLELEPVGPPPEPEIPLISRRTRGAALQRTTLDPGWPAPPVDDAESEEQKFAIITEEDAEAPVEGEDHDESYIVVRAVRPAAPASAIVPETPARSNALLYGMGAVALLAACVLLYLFVFSSDASTVGSVSNDPARGATGDAVNPAPASAATSISDSSVAMAAQIPNAEAVAPGATVPFVGAAPSEPAVPAVATTSGLASPATTGSAPTGAPTADSSIPAATSGVTPAAPGTPAGAVEAPVGSTARTPSATPPGSTEPGRPATAPAMVGAPTPAVVAATARPASGVKISSNPPGATVVIDGVERGRTPVVVPSLGSGRHSVRLTRPGYKPVDTTIDLDGSEQQLSLSLEAVRTPPPATAAPSAPAAAGSSLTLLVTSNEIGADVFVDETRVGSVPMTVTLSPGRHSVRVVPREKPEKVETVTVGGDVSPGQRERRHFEF